MIRVGVVGYGTIGKRVADALRDQPDTSLLGVAKRTPDYAAAVAASADIPLYTAPAAAAAFRSAGIDVAGDLSDLVATADAVVDATPAGVGAENRRVYAEHNTPAVFQGGESADVAPSSFVARANYGTAVDADAVRVLSCNATGLARLLAALDAFGVDTARCTLVRRGGDPAQSDRGPINDILPDPLAESHHARDVRAVCRGIGIRTRAVTVPATLMHLQCVRVTLEHPPSSVATVREQLAAEPRLCLVDETLGVDGAGALTELARDRGRPRNDLWENCVFAGSIALAGDELSLFQGIHQESNVVPENIDAVRAVTGAADAESSRRRTNRALGIGTLVDVDATVADAVRVDEGD